MLDLNEFIPYFVTAWTANIVLNLLGTIKMYKEGVNAIDVPLDFGVKLGGRRLMGDSITLIGLGLCLLLAGITLLLPISHVYATIPILVYIGGAIGSFVKRRIGKKQGSHLIVVDHGDYMVVTGLVLLAFHQVTISLVVTSIALTYVLHPLCTYVAYKLRLRVDPI